MRRTVIAITAVLALPAAAPAHATSCGAGGVIAFQHHAGSATGWDVYAVRPDGTGLTPLIATAADEQSPAWSPDGTKLAFTRPDGVWTADADGTARHRVAAVANALNPTWSPDGGRIAFQASVADVPTAQSFEIGVVAAGGGPPTMLHPGFAPAWAPDGTRIAFATATAVPVVVRSQLETMAPDGTQVAELPGADLFGTVSHLAWAPDGRRLAFSQPSYRGIPAHVGVVAAATGQEPVTIPTGDLAGVSWSPDGARLLYGWADRATEGLRSAPAAGVGSAGTSVLTHGLDAMPAWQPQGGEPGRRGRAAAPSRRCGAASRRRGRRARATAGC